MLCRYPFQGQTLSRGQAKFSRTSCLPGRLSLQRCSATKQAQQAATSDLLPLTLASSLLWQQPLAARADEAAPAAAVEAVTEGAQQAVTAAAGAATDAAAGPSWLSYAVVLSPIIFYGIFNVYRSQVNPRIKFSDFLFIVAGVAVVANLVSIIAFKVRLF